jgi:hypothetical protein
MTIRRSFIPVGLGMIMIVTVLVCSMSKAACSMGKKPDEQAVTYKKMSMHDYQNFIGNWDEKKDPVLYTLISTPAQYNALFFPAAVMGAKRPVCPDVSLYSKEQILVVARVLLYPKDVDTVFEVERISERDQQLALHYRFNEQESTMAWQGKVYMAVRIPKHNYKKVLFFENGKEVGELNTAAGQWSVPERILEPNN